MVRPVDHFAAFCETLIVVGASKITINLNGFVVKGDGGAGDFGVVDLGGFDGVAVKNGTLRNFESGVNANSADSFGISNVVASGNTSDGIFVNGASASIESTTGSGNGDAGIDVLGALASITSSTASGNGDDGVDVNGASASIKSVTAFGNGADGISVSSDAATIKSNQAKANGFPAGASDLAGLGILVFNFTTPPVGTNTALGNDDPAECVPASLC